MKYFWLFILAVGLNAQTLLYPDRASFWAGEAGAPTCDTTLAQIQETVYTTKPLSGDPATFYQECYTTPAITICGADLYLTWAGDVCVQILDASGTQVGTNSDTVTVPDQVARWYEFTFNGTKPQIGATTAFRLNPVQISGTSYWHRNDDDPDGYIDTNYDFFEYAATNYDMVFRIKIDK